MQFVQSFMDQHINHIDPDITYKNPDQGLLAVAE